MKYAKTIPKIRWERHQHKLKVFYTCIGIESGYFIGMEARHPQFPLRVDTHAVGERWKIV